MNKKKFAEAMNMVDDRYYEEAENYQHKRRVPIWGRRGALAACLFLMFVVAATALPSILKPEESEGGGANVDGSPNEGGGDTNIRESQNALETAPTMFAHQNVIDAIKQDIADQDIESWAEAENAVLDFKCVIPVYTTANAAKDSHTILETLAFDNQYMIPVISNEKCIGTVTVEQYENKWIVSTMYRNFDLKTEVEKNKDIAVCFIEVIQLQGFGFLISDDTNEEFITISSFGIFENMSGEKLLNWILNHQKGGDEFSFRFWSDR